MNGEMNTTTLGQPLWGAVNDLGKQEKRELLFKEAGDCCMVCGKPRSENDEWAMAQIIPEKKPRYVQLDGRTIICHDCVVQKGRASIPLFASSRPFADRFGYWRRVQTGFMRGLISSEKKDLLLKDFSLLRRNTDTAVRKGSTTYLNLLMEETCGTCIYCGMPLAQHEMTYDHLFPKSRGGKSTLENYVLSCHDCNNTKSNKPVDVFIRSWPEKRQIRFVHRVNDLVRAGRLPEKKAKMLLSFRNESTSHVQFRLFHNLFRFTFTRVKI